MSSTDRRTDGQTDRRTDGQTDKVNPVYPPSNFVGRGYNNKCDNINGFVSELEPILSDLSNTNSEVLICGDYNVNLLKTTWEQHFSYFFDTMLSRSFFPKITFPARVNNSSGATLIDNIFYKLSSITLQMKARILLDEISDHYPYFISLDIGHKPTKPIRLIKKGLNSSKAIQDMLTDMTECDIWSKMNNDLSSNMIFFMII